MAAGLVTAAIAVGGCGGSNSSAARTKLVKNLSAQLGRTGLPQDLASCVTQQARKLPTPQLREVSDAGSNASPATRQVVAGMLTGCIDEGKGVSELRSLLTQSVAGGMSGSVPANYTNCVTSKVGAATPTQLSEFVSAYITGGQVAAETIGRQFGVTLGEECLQSSGMAAKIRARFLAPIENGLAASHFSAAFKSCVLHKAEHVSTSQVTAMVLHPASANALGQALGRDFARACIASGAKP